MTLQALSRAIIRSVCIDSYIGASRVGWQAALPQTNAFRARANSAE